MGWANPHQTSALQATHQTASLSVMDDDDEWDTDPDHVAPPDSKGTGAGQRAIDNPFDQNRRHSQEIAAQKQQTATVAAREAPKVVKKAPGGTIGGGGGEPCTACGKTVYAAEKIAAGKGVWHKDCFTCGSCFKKLDLHSYRIDRASGKPYCVAHLPAEDRSRKPGPAPVAAPAPTAPARVPAPAPVPAPKPAPAPAAPAPVAPAAARAPAPARVKSFGGGGEKCHGCGKTVYAAEPLVEERRAWAPGTPPNGPTCLAVPKGLAAPADPRAQRAMPEWLRQPPLRRPQSARVAPSHVRAGGESDGQGAGLP